eukprot:537095-Pelagomonas_calceolata.AAC.6
MWLEYHGLDFDIAHKAGLQSLRVSSACSCTRCWPSCTAIARPLLFQQYMLMHEVLDLLYRHSKAATLAAVHAHARGAGPLVPP